MQKARNRVVPIYLHTVGESMNPKPLKTISTAIIATLIILSILPATLLIPKTYAQGTITLSSENLHPHKVIEIIVNLPGVDVTEGIDLRVTDAAGEPLDLTYKSGSAPTGVLKAARLAPGVYVAYLGGHGVDLDTNPQYPKRVINASIAKVPDISAGSTIVIEVLGYGISTTVTYNSVKPVSISLDRKEVPARRTGEYTVKLTVVDQDLNLDPTKIDDLSTYGYGINISVTWISGTTGQVLNKSLLKTDAGIKESAVNSGKFTVSFTVDEITPTGATLAKGDIFLLDVASDINFGDDNTKTLTDKLTVVYRYPEISISFTQQGVTIDIKSPDDNVDTGAKDNLDSTKNVIVSFADISCDIPGTSFIETDKNTAIFRYTLAVEWGSANNLICTPPKVVIGLDEKSFTLTATYLDITGSGTYVTASPEVTVVKASPVNVVLLVKDRDINVNPNSIDTLSSVVDAANDKIYLENATLTIYEVFFRKPDGTTVDIPSGYPPTGIVFFETDFDTGEFRLAIPSTGIFEAGKSYTIVIKDHTGDYTVSVPITISPVKIELDRSVYPINRDNPVVIHITYIDDRYNEDPAVIETIPSKVVNYTVVNPVTGEIVVSETSVDNLKETGPDTGIFTGKITISADLPKYIDAKITVYTAETKAEAVFKVYQLVAGDLKVEPTSINITGCFKITVNDPDANVDSKNADSITVYVKDVSESATETDVNTGVFTVTVCAKDLAVDPGTTITVKYTEKTPPLSPTATSFAGSEYDIKATVKVVSFTGLLVVPKDWIGPYEKMSISVKDPDLNRDPERAEGPVTVRVVVEGRVETYSVELYETDVNTGEFAGDLSIAYLVYGTYTPSPANATKLIDKRVTIMYIDEADATGARATQIATLTVKAFDAEILVDKTAVNVGESFKITIKNPDIAQNPAPEFRKVIIRSTTYPVGVVLYAAEVEPGVYEVTVTAVNLKDWVMGAPQIPAKLGDTITIEYEDPIAADGKSKLFSKSIAVGVFVEMPGKAEAVKTVDVVTGAEVTPKVGREVFLTISVKNTDIVERSMTAIVVVRDPDGVAVARFAASFTLGAGASTEQAFGWTPIVSGSHTVEVYIVRSLADRTPVGEPATFTVFVEA